MTRARVNQLLRRRRAGDPDPLTTTMIAKLDTPSGRRTYKKRAATIEPVFAQIKHNRSIRCLTRRGLAAADSEWKLICATHNPLKIYHRRPLGLMLVTDLGDHPHRPDLATDRRIRPSCRPGGSRSARACRLGMVGKQRTRTYDRGCH